MSSEPIVRLTRPNDINHLIMIDLKCYQYPMPMKEWQEKINGSGQDGQARIVVCEFIRVPVGYAMWNIGFDNIGTLHRVCVLPQFRHKRLGTLLIAACLKHCYENQCDIVRTTVPDIHCCPNDPDDVSVFLNKCGFRATGKIDYDYKIMYGNNVDGYIFERDTYANRKS